MTEAERTACALLIRWIDSRVLGVSPDLMDKLEDDTDAFLKGLLEHEAKSYIQHSDPGDEDGYGHGI